MSDSYSTGEVAKDLGITVRAVQYYDKRELVKPSDFSEGGRRQYTKEDLEKLRLVTFLRDMDFSLAAIKAILTEDHNEQILELLLVQQIEQMTAEISDKKMKRDRALMLLKGLQKDNQQSLGYLSDMSRVMKTQKKWKSLQRQMILIIVSLTGLFWLSILIATHFDNKLLLWLAVGGFLFAINAMVIYYKNKVSYLCPNCHQTFDPTYKDFSLAKHTPKTRRLVCPHCNEKHYCLEIAKDA